MKYADHVYRSADDRLDLYARIYDTEGPPLLLMHGLTRNSGDFEALAGHLAGKYQLIVPDQRGRGRSDYDPDSQNYTPAVYVDDMFALIDGLQLGNLGMIGTSMGGLMAMMMAAMSPERFDSLILNDIGPAVEAAGLARIQGYIGRLAPFDSWQQAADHWPSPAIPAGKCPMAKYASPMTRRFPKAFRAASKPSFHQTSGRYGTDCPPCPRWLSVARCQTYSLPLPSRK